MDLVSSSFFNNFISYEYEQESQSDEKQEIGIINDLPKEVILIIFKNLSKEDLISCDLTCNNWKVIATQIKGHPFSLFLQKRESIREHVYIEKSKRTFGMSLGILTTATGVATLMAGTPFLIPSIILGAGPAMFFSSMKCPDTKFSTEDVLKETAYGAISSIISGGVGALGPAKLLIVNQTGVRVVNSLASQLISTVTINLMKEKEFPDAKTIASTTLSSLASSGSSEGLNKLFMETDDLTNVAIRKFFIGSGSSGVGKIAGNICKNEKWNKDLGKAVAMGGFLGAVNGVHDARELQKFRDLMDHVAKIAPDSLQNDIKNIETLKQEHLQHIQNQFGSKIEKLINKGYTLSGMEKNPPIEDIFKSLASGNTLDFSKGASIKQIVDLSDGPANKVISDYISNLQQKLDLQLQKYTLYLQEIEKDATSDQPDLGKNGYLIDEFLASGFKHPIFGTDKNAMLRHLAQGGELNLWVKSHNFASTPEQFDQLYLDHQHFALEEIYGDRDAVRARIASGETIPLYIPIKILYPGAKEIFFEIFGNENR